MTNSFFNFTILSRPKATTPIALSVAFILLLAFATFGNCSSAGAISFHTVTFNENLQKGISLSAAQASSGPANLTPYSNLSPAFADPGYAFKNWNTSPAGTGTTYQNGASYSFATDLILYAQWTPLSHIVTFNENRSLTDLAISVQVGNKQMSLTLFANLSPSLSNPGYSFSSWNTKANGSGVRYTNGQSYSFAADLTLYAQWAKSAAALNFVGSVQNSQSLTQLNAVANVILSHHFHQVQVIQFHNQDGATIIGLLTKILVRHDGPGITVALKRTNTTSNSTGVEVFAN